VARELAAPADGLENAGEPLRFAARFGSSPPTATHELERIEETPHAAILTRRAWRRLAPPSRTRCVSSGAATFVVEALLS